MVREDGAGRLESLHNGVRRAVLGRKVGSWIVGMAVAKKKNKNEMAGLGRGGPLQESVSPPGRQF